MDSVPEQTKSGVSASQIEALRAQYPNGHPMFAELTMQEMVLHDNKNHDYAHGGHPLGNFLRVSQILSLYPGLNMGDPAIVAMVYAMKQLDAYLWIKANGIATRVEGIQGRLGDISVYTKLVQCIELDAAQRTSLGSGNGVRIAS